jgi:hypothetical protein
VKGQRGLEDLVLCYCGEVVLARGRFRGRGQVRKLTSTCRHVFAIILQECIHERNEAEPISATYFRTYNKVC